MVDLPMGKLKRFEKSSRFLKGVGSKLREKKTSPFLAVVV